MRKFIDNLIDNLLDLQSQLQRSHYVYFKNLIADLGTVFKTAINSNLNP